MASQKMHSTMKDMQNNMSQPSGAKPQDDEVFAKTTAKESKTSKGDYIDFEEIK